jgi:hypothetical protein
MKAQRSTIAMRAERVEQLKLMAEIHKLPVTMFLEELIRKQARRDEVQLPGLMVFTSNDSPHVLFGFEVTKDGESLPLTSLTAPEARQLAKCLVAAMEKPRRLLEPVGSVTEGVAFDVGRQSVAVTIDAHVKGGKSYRKTISQSMAKDVVDWLKAAAAQIEKR